MPIPLRRSPQNVGRSMYRTMRFQKDNIVEFSYMEVLNSAADDRQLFTDLEK